MRIQDPSRVTRKKKVKIRPQTTVVVVVLNKPSTKTLWRSGQLWLVVSWCFLIQVAMCSKSVVYGTKKLKGGKEQVKARDWKKKGEFKLREGVQNQPFSNMGYSDTHDTYIHT